MFFLKCIRLFFLFLKDIVTTIGKFITCFFNLIKNSLSFIKGLIDFIYKLFFIAFFCVLGYICYQVFTSASVINKKLDKLQSGITYIKQISEDLSKTTQKVSSISDTFKSIDLKENTDKIVKTASKVTEKIISFA